MTARAPLPLLWAPLAALLWLCPQPAGAQIFGTLDELKEDEYQPSPQYFMLEIKAGPYAPDIDKEFDGAASPFGDLFGSGTGLMLQGEFDLELWRPFGTLAVGAVAGWYSKSAYTFVDDGSDQAPSSGKTRGNGETSITLVPLAGLLIYRADFIFTRYNVPLVPYFKAGINYSFWWIKKGDGNTASYGGEEATGGTWGWQINAGLSVALDAFEPQAAKTLDLESGINHTYLFFEFAHVQADGFGSGKALNVGDTGWQAGLGFEF